MILVVTGTDTGVGKSLVTAGIALAARADGLRVRAIKPVESGWSEGNPGDGERLAEAAGQDEPRRALQRYREPLAPPMAAELEPELREPDPAAWVAQILAVDADADLTLVEGAGGLTSPLAWNYDLRDLARDLDAPLVVVGANRIGVLHQLRSVVELAEQAGLGVHTLVLSAVEEDASDPSPETNPELVRRVLGQFPCFELPRVRDAQEVARLYRDWLAKTER